MEHWQLKIVEHCGRLVMADNVPVDKGSKEATFTALAADSKFDDKVRALFLDEPMENLEDFRFYFADEKEIDAFVAAEKSLERLRCVTPTGQSLAARRGNLHV